jgi:hypothetical protein
MLKHMVTGLGVVLLLTAPFASAQAALLAKVEADVDGSGQKKIVELTGDKKMPGSNYYSDLWIIIKNNDGKMLTAWKADLDGGYYCLLEKMPVNGKADQKTAKIKQNNNIREREKGAASEKKDVNAKQNTAAPEKEKISDKENVEKRFEKLLESLEEVETADKEQENHKIKISDKPHDQILLLAAKGGKNAAVGCRIMDFSDLKQARAVFSAADSLGIAATAEYKPDNRFLVESSLPGKEGTENTVSFTGSAKNVLRLYNADGSIAKPYLHPLVTEVASLTTLGGRLFTEQNVLAANGQDLLGRLAVRWAYKEDKWIPEEITLRDTLDELLKPDADDSNRAGGAGNWRLYPRRAFIGDRVISRPVVAVEEKPELQNKINEKLNAWYAKAPEEDERAFQVKFAGTQLLSLELGRRNIKGEVIRELYNFDMKSGESLKLDEMFNTKNPDFIKVINLVGKPKNRFSAAKPVFWHFTGKHFILQDRLLGEGFQDEDAICMAVVEKSDLLPFVKDKKLLEE